MIVLSVGITLRLRPCRRSDFGGRGRSHVRKSRDEAEQVRFIAGCKVEQYPLTGVGLGVGVCVSREDGSFGRNHVPPASLPAQ